MCDGVREREREGRRCQRAGAEGNGEGIVTINVLKIRVLSELKKRSSHMAHWFNRRDKCDTISVTFFIFFTIYYGLHPKIGKCTLYPWT